MDRYVPEWAKVGVEVVESRGGFGEHYGKTSKITKILGNGNARIEGSDQQWRIHNGYLAQTGSYSYGGTTYRHLDVEQRERVLKVAQVAKAKKVLQDEADRLEKLWRHGDEDAMIAAAATIKPANGG